MSIQQTNKTNGQQTYSVDMELVIGIVAPVGADLSEIISISTNWLKKANYGVGSVNISTDVIFPAMKNRGDASANEFNRIDFLMNAGNQMRKESGNNILGLGAAAQIKTQRESESPQRRAYIIKSLKHPDEVLELRRIYHQAFYLIAVFADETSRMRYFVDEKGISEEDAKLLMSRDYDEGESHGQKVSDTFHLADFFIRLTDSKKRLRHDIHRIFEILFGHPYRTPTFDEYAMFLAFAASLRSADLSRQVGAVVAVNNEVIATGANECPSAGGGLYWSSYDDDGKVIVDYERGRDFKRGHDSNRKEQEAIISEISNILVETGVKGRNLEDIRSALKKSRIRDLTEYGRVVHAEMEAILACARTNISAKGGVIYCTTFPCHNCAKHIIAAGIRRVVFVEPYQKSKALTFHDDSLELGLENVKKKSLSGKVSFEPFIGVGPRRFFDLFSVCLGSGRAIIRKDGEGNALKWKVSTDIVPKLGMLAASYLELEHLASEHYSGLRARLRPKNTRRKKNVRKN